MPAHPALIQLTEYIPRPASQRGLPRALSAREVSGIRQRRRLYLALRRCCDIFNALWLLILLSPVLLLSALAIRIHDRGRVFYRQERLTGGTGGPRVFRIFKFRTMIEGADEIGSKITEHRDPRITPVGRILRTLKIDEMPQLFNILAGEMSFVGPRPQTMGFVEAFHDHYEAIHSVIPAGLTDLASLTYADEGRMLSKAEDPERFYLDYIMPHKIECHVAYLERMGLLLDAWILLATVLHVFVHKPLLRLIRR